MVESVGIIVPPLRHQSKFTLSNSLSNYLTQFRDDDAKYRQTIEEYLFEMPCLRYQLELKYKELFVIVRLKFPNINDNTFNDRGVKNQVLNLNIIHSTTRDISIIRNKRDITEDKMRIGFKLPETNSLISELSICFEHVLIDRSKLLKSFKKDEGNPFVDREVEIDVRSFADFEEFQKLYNNYGNDLLLNIEKSEEELNKLEQVVLGITEDLSIITSDENIKRDLNENIFRNTLVFQLFVIGSIVIFNLMYLYNLLRHLQKKKVIG